MDIQRQELLRALPDEALTTERLRAEEELAFIRQLHRDRALKAYMQTFKCSEEKAHRVVASFEEAVRERPFKFSTGA